MGYQKLNLVGCMQDKYPICCSIAPDLVLITLNLLIDDHLIKVILRRDSALKGAES